MAKLRDRTCLICSAKYNYCSNCGSYDPTETWRNLFCSKNCKDIFSIVSKCFDDGVISIEQAYIEISDLDLSNKKNFNKRIQTDIRKILESNKKDNNIAESNTNANNENQEIQDKGNKKNVKSFKSFIKNVQNDK